MRGGEGEGGGEKRRRRRTIVRLRGRTENEKIVKVVEVRGGVGGP